LLSLVLLNWYSQQGILFSLPSQRNFPISFKPKVAIAEFFWKMQRKTWYSFLGLDAMPLSLKKLLLKLDFISKPSKEFFFNFKFLSHQSVNIKTQFTLLLRLLLIAAVVSVLQLAKWTDDSNCCGFQENHWGLHFTSWFSPKVVSFSFQNHE
jgi:hypothetical protein